MSMKSSWSVGDWVIYRKSKRSTSPGPRAQNITPSTKGDNYHYTIDKYWVVSNVLPDGVVELKTARGKTHQLASDDPLLRRPKLWETWFLRQRFREIETLNVGEMQNVVG